VIDAWLADLVVLLHLAFIAFAALGGLLALRWPRVAWLHVPAVLWGIAIEASGRICPLTPLENSLRRAAGEAGYQTSFVERYLAPIVYPEALTPAVQLGLAAALLLANAVIYTAVVRRWYAGREEGRP
jgi:hypothetical protein